MTRSKTYSSHIAIRSTCCRSRVRNLEEVSNNEIRSARDLSHHPTTIIQLIGFHADPGISRKVGAGPRIHRRRLRKHPHVANSCFTVTPPLCLPPTPIEREIGLWHCEICIQFKAPVERAVQVWVLGLRERDQHLWLIHRIPTECTPEGVVEMLSAVG